MPIGIFYLPNRLNGIGLENLPVCIDYSLEQLLSFHLLNVKNSFDKILIDK